MTPFASGMPELLDHTAAPDAPLASTSAPATTQASLEWAARFAAENMTLSPLGNPPY